MLRVSPLICVFVALTCSPAYSEVEECWEVENDLDRLACYDRASGRSPSIRKVQQDSAWDIRSETSAFQDTTDVYMRLESEGVVACNQFGPSQKATLLLRCMENSTNLYIATNCHLASGFHGYGEVEYRIDQNKARTKQFDSSTDNKALGLWSGGTAIPMIKEMFGAETLLVRFTPFNMNPVTASFPISGTESAVSELRKACHW
jgi:type VI secretion system protein VasI